MLTSYLFPNPLLVCVLLCTGPDAWEGPIRASSSILVHREFVLESFVCCWTKG